MDPLVPSQTQAQTFFIDALSVYRKIVDANHMHHQELYCSLSSFLKHTLAKKPSLLDLGCGDAGMMRAALVEAEVGRYRGLDLSDVALDQAKINLEHLDIQTDFDCVDMLAYLKAPPLEQFDVIFSGYALHHLDDAGKFDLISAAMGHLKPEGVLLIADVFREEEEGLGDYLDRFCSEIRYRWSGLSAEEIQHTENHVRGFDQPGTVRQLQELARHLSLPSQRIFSQSFYQMLVIGPLTNA